MKSSIKKSFVTRTAYIFFVLFIAMVSSSQIRAESLADLDRVQAAFIYQFTNYIEWPESKKEESADFNITVLGNSSIFQHLSEISKNKKIRDKKINLHQAQSLADLKDSQLVILVFTEEKILTSLVKKTKGSSTLIISKEKGFAEKGSMINFFLEDGKLRFEMNRERIESEKLKVSSQLLKLAKLI
ncbi:MAG: YfiR family protein [Bdellovibrionota bacterium]